ncbi:MAG TPA: glycoside hydrolase family 28 protein [Candidatus Sulfopaludibacter sp.]|nr:glycoside hydrolase family 28 protein [Candidatus Sulfopaludibacter sp.]
MTDRREFLKRAALSAAGMVGVAHAAAPESAFDVRTFGAKGDGKTVDSPAVNKAIEAASAAGGGTVAFPAGNYLCFSIRLKSNVALYLGEGATIVAADTPEGGAQAYDAAEPNQWDRYQDFGHSHFHNSLIWGEGIENTGITGSGRIWGKGLSRGQGAANPGVGNKSIGLKNCHNVLLRDFSILHGGHFGILATGVDNLTIDNLKIDTNRDGMDVDSCRNVRISNCYVNSPWDDGICLKADYALGSARQTEFVTITNCYVSGCWEEGTLLDGTYKKFAADARVPHTGRIKFGTESAGGFRNITISNCVFEGCQGLALETVDGALLEDVTVTNISMRDIMSAPIFMRLGRRLRAPEGRAIGTLKRIIINNVVCSNSVAALGSIISGIPGHHIEDVKISNVQIQHQGGGTKQDAAYQPIEAEDIYPEPDMFTATPRPGRNGRGPNGDFVAEGQGRAAGQPAGRGAANAAAPVERHKMPSQGFYIRHVTGIEFDNIVIQAETPDERPAFVLEDVQGADFFRVKTPHAADAPVFALHNVGDLSVRMCSGVKDTELQKVDQRTL